MPYATFADVTALGFEVDASEQTKFDRLLLPAAARLIDRACEVADGFFEAASEEASEQTFYGDGSDYLSVPPFVAASVTEVALPAGYSALEAGDYYAASDPRGRAFYLVRQYGASRLPLTDAGAWMYNGLLPVFPVGPYDLVTNNFRASARGEGWPRGVAVRVTARWGFGVVPAEVVLATVETAVRMWRQLDEAGAKVSDVEQQTPAALGTFARAVVDKYREQRAAAFA